MVLSIRSISHEPQQSGHRQRKGRSNENAPNNPTHRAIRLCLVSLHRPDTGAHPIQVETFISWDDLPGTRRKLINAGPLHFDLDQSDVLSGLRDAVGLRVLPGVLSQLNS
jgi:hypothetical protein